jgi:ParB family chromosome partitioning protein
MGTVESEIAPPDIAGAGAPASGTTVVDISSITVGERIRKEFGDIDALAASIDELGLLHPIIIDKHHKLLAGERRLRAVKKLGWTTIPATIART